MPRKILQFSNLKKYGRFKVGTETTETINMPIESKLQTHLKHFFRKFISFCHIFYLFPGVSWRSATCWKRWTCCARPTLIGRCWWWLVNAIGWAPWSPCRPAGERPGLQCPNFSLDFFFGTYNINIYLYSYKRVTVTILCRNCKMMIRKLWVRWDGWQWSRKISWCLTFFKSCPMLILDIWDSWDYQNLFVWILKESIHHVDLTTRSRDIPMINLWGWFNIFPNHPLHVTSNKWLSNYDFRFWMIW